jgi:hypothetical protein
MCLKIECNQCGRVTYTEWCGQQFASNHNVKVEYQLCPYCQKSGSLTLQSLKLNLQEKNLSLKNENISFQNEKIQ